MLTYGIPPEFRGGVLLFIYNRHTPSGHAIAYRWRSLPRVRRHGASKPQGSSERVLPWQVTMDQLIFASLSQTHYWYEVGMLKVPYCTVFRVNVHLNTNSLLYCIISVIQPQTLRFGVFAESLAANKRQNISAEPVCSSEHSV